MLRSGTYVGEYADIQTMRKRDLEIQSQIAAREKAEAKARQESHTKSLAIVDKAIYLANSDSSFRAKLLSLIEKQIPLLKPFLSRQLGLGFTSAEVLDDPKSLYLLAEPINNLFREFCGETVSEN